MAKTNKSATKAPFFNGRKVSPANILTISIFKDLQFITAMVATLATIKRGNTLLLHYLGNTEKGIEKKTSFFTSHARSWTKNWASPDVGLIDLNHSRKYPFLFKLLSQDQSISRRDWWPHVDSSRSKQPRFW